MSKEEFPKKELETLWAPWRVEYFEKEPRDRDFLETAARASDDAQHLVITRRKNSFLMMNRYPYTVGHLMAVPYRKVAELSVLGENEIVELWGLVVHAQTLLRAAAKAQGFNIGLNLGALRGRRRARSFTHSHRAALERRYEFHADHWRRARPLGWLTRVVPKTHGSAGEDGFATLNREFDVRRHRRNDVTM